MIIGLDRVNKLTISIIIVIILLGICISMDSAEEDITAKNENTIENLSKQHNATIINSSSDITSENDGLAKSDGKIYTEKEKIKKIYSKTPLITITSKPSCGCHHGYYWHKRTFENYCPNCHRYGTLHNAHKSGSRYEQELTCSNCDSDFCGVCGKEKYSWSRVYLKPKAKGVTYIGEWSVVE